MMPAAGRFRQSGAIVAGAQPLRGMMAARCPPPE
jgi:hypothetical protein